MAYAKCPQCGSVFHLRLTPEGAEQWQREHAEALAAGQPAAVKCFHCWKELRELEVVEVLVQPSSAPEVSIGERGTVVAVLQSERGEVAYEVECVAADGTTKWEHPFVRSQLKATPTSNGAAT